MLWTLATNMSISLTPNGQIAALGLRKNFALDSQASIGLASGASVAVKQISTCALAIHISDKSHGVLAFPYPIEARSFKAKVARKGSYVEVGVPLRDDNFTGEYQLNSFPVLTGKSTAACWSVPRVNIDQQAIISRFDKQMWD